MNARIWKIAAAACLAVSAAGCSEDEGRDPAPVTPPGPTVTLTTSDTSIIANGVNTVTLAVTDGGGSGPIDFTTTRGTFSNGLTTFQLAGATGTVTLTTCDAIAVPTCAGTATVTATGPSGTDSVTIAFGSLASVCPSNCSADPGCALMACTLTAGGTGSCSATTPSTCTSAPACTPSPAGATSEVSCTDGVDNDCDGDTDCEDAQCDTLACDTGSPTSFCKTGACTDLASGLAVVVTPARVRLPANGTTTTSVVVQVTSNDDPAPNMDVTLATTAGTLSALSGTTDSNGTVTVTFTAPATPGVAVITATADLVPTVKGTATITIPRLGSLQIPDPYALHPIMGVRSSGWNELGGVLVQVLDDLGQPYPDGLAVRFEHRTLGGSTFGDPTTACVPAATGCVAYPGAIWGGADAVDETGLASAPLVSGTLAGTLVVTATTTAGGVTRTVTLPNVSVIGAKANLANLSIQCSPRNVPALAEHDCSTSWVDAPITCAALLKDRFNNLLGTSTQVVFASEAAAVGQVAWTPAYDPEAQGPDQADLGTATQIFQTLGAGLPFDVAPQGNEDSVDHGLDGCGVRTHNPRDGVVTIVAVTDGEEAFFDANGSGAYEAGEPFVDQGEPFIDQDDDGAYTAATATSAGEWFLDVDGDGAYTPGNLAWDASAKIWTQTVVVYTSYAQQVVADAATPTFLGTRWVDGFTDACTATPAPAPFLVYAKVTGPPEIPPSSEGFVVVASDMNLNRLHGGTTYDVEVLGDGKVQATYWGLESYADDLGMFYRYWPCDQGGACASQCRATGAAAPCTMAPSISAFSCGIAAGVTITGGDEPDGWNTVQWSVDTPYDLYLGGKVMHSGETFGGENLARP
jgi:hypothetical protein